MKYKDMLKFIHQERTKMDNAVNAILKKCGGKEMRPDKPAFDTKAPNQ
jgi:hypothetical protein